MDATFILFIIAQTLIAIWAIIKLYFSNVDHEKRITVIEREQNNLNNEVRRFSDTLLVVKRNTELLLDGRIKPPDHEQY